MWGDSQLAYTYRFGTAGARACEHTQRQNVHALAEKSSGSGEHRQQQQHPKATDRTHRTHTSRNSHGTKHTHINCARRKHFIDINANTAEVENGWDEHAQKRSKSICVRVLRQTRGARRQYSLVIILARCHVYLSRCRENRRIKNGSKWQCVKIKWDLSSMCAFLRSTAPSKPSKKAIIIWAIQNMSLWHYVTCRTMVAYVIKLNATTIMS